MAGLFIFARRALGIAYGYANYMLALVAVASLLSFSDPATSSVAETHTPAPQKSFQREPIAEIVVLSGPMLWFPSNSRVFEGNRISLGASLGAYTRVGVFSAFYSRVSDDDSCGPDSWPSGNTGSFDLASCAGVMEQAGAQYRLISMFGKVHPWVGVGGGWYQKRGSGTRIYTGEDFDGFPRSRSSVHRYAEGIALFLSYGAEYAFGERIALGLDLQLGVRYPYFVTEGNRAREEYLSVPEAGHGGFLTSSATVRLAYQVY